MNHLTNLDTIDQFFIFIPFHLRYRVNYLEYF
jgi:hypothetical protein